MSIRWTNIFHARFWIGIAMAGFICAVVFGLIWDPLTYPAFFIGMALSALALLSDETVYTCPHCRKRVKTGASTCHHCGRQVT